jgi:enamine deaminase RidA (YjgF/YER057c/UK114 family)
MPSLLLVASLLLAAATPAVLAAQPVQARDSSYIRGDRTFYHQYAAGERQWGYAQAVVVGNTIYVSGTVGAGETVEEELANIYRRIDRTLRANGFTMQDIVRETAYTKDIPALAAANAVRLLAYAGHTPAATWVQITRLLAEGATVEIEVTAVRAAAPR